MGLVMQQSQIRQRGLLSHIVRIVWAVGFVLIFGSLSHHFSPRPLGTLLGCAVSVLLAGMMNGTPSAIAALITAALLGAYWLPPANSLGIAPSLRFGYGTFLILCSLISFYRPPRGTTRTEPRSQPPPRSGTYTEEDLPTVITADQIRSVPAQRTIQGDDLYQWERTSAHLSDLIWDAQIRLNEEEPHHAMMLMQHAYDIATQMRSQIASVTIDAERRQEPPSAPDR